MRATIRNLAQKIDNPGPGFEQVINGRTPQARLEHLHEQAVARVRRKQIERYTHVCGEANDLLDDNLAVVNEALKATAQMGRDLKRGLIEPAEVMAKVADSIRGVQAVVADVRRVEKDEEAATAMVDQSPEDYEQGLIERFPAMAEQATPILTDEYLRGEQDSPFREGGDD